MTNNFALNSPHLFMAVLETVHQQIAILDDKGHIIWVNRAWKLFYAENDGSPEKNWHGENYVSICEKAASLGDEDASNVLSGIREVINGIKDEYYFEYPCHSPAKKRWFLMRFRPLEWDGPKHFVVVHLDITERKLAEEKAAKMSTLDGLTGIPNRKTFDKFLRDQWNRTKRLGLPISLLFFDVDLFKNYNDHYGHIAGDKCLQRIGQVLEEFPRRADDLVARYGGEEFCIVLGNTDSAAAQAIAEKVRHTIQSLSISHDYGTDANCVTVSVGVATMRPGIASSGLPEQLIEAADQALYSAKETGRNRVCVHDSCSI